MVSPSVKKNKSAAKGKVFEKNISSGKVFKKKGKQEEKYPLCPWKMTGCVRVSLYFCKKCAEANIYMGNIYEKTWKEDPEPAQDVEENEEDPGDVNEEDEDQE
ncbi:hypothetical protein AAVH_39500 [Aphelenchoides avenae]|nr:hypothetical protein AAVH_39500 [Aphelenchus avenae]